MNKQYYNYLKNNLEDSYPILNYSKEKIDIPANEVEWYSYSNKITANIEKVDVKKIKNSVYSDNYKDILNEEFNKIISVPTKKENINNIIAILFLSTLFILALVYFILIMF